MEQVKAPLKKIISDLEIKQGMSKISDVFNHFSGFMKNDCPEKMHVLTKLTEAGMWFRMYAEMEIAEGVGQPQMKIKEAKVSEAERL